MSYDTIDLSTDSRNTIASGKPGRPKKPTASPIKIKDWGPAIERFHRKYAINSKTGCWEWVCCTHHGYGTFSIGSARVRAHRFAYENLVGPIPPVMQVCHTCDNKRCVAPAHLFLGSAKDNQQDKVRKGRCYCQPGQSPKKVSDAMVLNIRIMYARGTSMKELASIYPLGEFHIAGILKGRKRL